MEFLYSNKLLIFIIEEWKLLSFLTIIFLLYFYYTSTFKFFEERGVKYMKPTILLGNLGPRLTLKISTHEFQLQVYDYFKGERLGGMFEGRRPLLFVFDPELIKAVTIKDFDHFVDRNALRSNQPAHISKSLLNLKGHEWKGVRSVLTPTFSSARLRHMLPLIQQCSDQMVEFLKQYDNKDVEMKDLMGHFTLEVIGVCAFGIKCDALTNENAHFVKIAEKFAYMPTPKRIFIFIVLMFMPSLFRLLNISFMNPETTQELLRILSAAKADRRLTNIKRSDFLQLMIDAMDAEKSQSEKDKSGTFMDDDTIDAQSILFLIAGYETSSSLLSFAIHILAIKPELQDKLRAHILEKTKDKEITYEVLAELDYLEGFLLETLRMYPPLARVDRVVTKKYTFPGTNVTLEPNNVVAIPVYGIHMDPNIYSDPTEFRPERFIGEERKNRPSHLFLAFGAGPRNCIGYRFAMFSAKLVMVTLLKNFQFTACPKTEHPVQFEKKGILLKAAHGLWVNIKSLDNDLKVM